MASAAASSACSHVPVDGAGRRHCARAAGRAAASSCAASVPATPTAPDVLHGLDLDVPAGETHAIVGATGVGQVDAAAAAAALRRPAVGPVLLDGQDVRDLDWDSLRGSIGYVAQDVFLFHGTVAENITYGRPDATASEVRAGRRGRRPHDFIEALPDGYDTVGRRAGREAVRRPAPAARARPGAPARPRRPGARRGDLRRRQRDRGRDPALAARAPPPSAPRSSSPTGSPRSATPTASACSTPAGSSRPAPTTSWSTAAGLRRPVAGPDRRGQEQDPVGG